MPERVQRRRTRGWRMPEGAVYVGRPSRWGNPFRIYHGHSLIGPSWPAARASWTHLPERECVWAYVTTSGEMTAIAAVKQFRVLLEIRERDEPDRFREWLAPLRGHHLACWCPLVDADGQHFPCHADILLVAANG